MSPTTKALWVIERNLAGPLSLSEIADACGASRYHLAHAFGASTGCSVMHYVRGRRLTVAAGLLATGAPDILHLALRTGYGSHEAFSRAFRAQFQVTPEMVRRKRSTAELAMINPMKPIESGEVALESPRIVTSGSMLIVGLSEKQSFETIQNIPAQWQRFMATYSDIPNKKNPIPIGLSMNMDDDGNFEYACGVEVSQFSKRLRGFCELRIPEQTYAVFEHRDHIAKIAPTYDAIWNNWLPNSNMSLVDGPSLERHLKTFNPQTGLGGVAIWIPIRTKP
jgi:AraC family transcriptional regulator